MMGTIIEVDLADYPIKGKLKTDLEAAFGPGLSLLRDAGISPLRYKYLDTENNQGKTTRWYLFEHYPTINYIEEKWGHSTNLLEEKIIRTPPIYRDTVPEPVRAF